VPSPPPLSPSAAREGAPFEDQLGRWNGKVSVLLKKINEQTGLHKQIRDKFQGQKNVKERMAWIAKFADDPDVASALLEAPACLVDLTDERLAVRLKIEAQALEPHVIEAKAAVTKAWSETQAG
jgi:hypothetical protein